MRLRSPATIAGILLAACALCLLGVALAVGGTTETKRPRLRSVAVERPSAASRPPPAPSLDKRRLSPVAGGSQLTGVQAPWDMGAVTNGEGEP